MRLVSYRLKGEAGVGVMVDDKNFVALPKAAPELPRSLKGLIEMEGGFAKAAAAAKGRKPDLAFSDVVLDPLITEPNAIWCLALNYKLHINETGLTTSAKYPQIFLRMPCSQVGHLQPILCPDPKISTKYEYEGELAVIIGKGGRHIPVERALDHVAGYACYNEGSVREYQGHNRQFGLGKNFEQSGSFGPWLMTPDEFGDPSKHRIITRVNGIERQNATTDLMVFGVPQLINYLSQGYFLRPGDVIVSGSPGSLPLHPGEKPTSKNEGGVYVEGMVQMKPGDVCEVEISGLGTLRNPVAADRPAEYQTKLYKPESPAG
ncbi:MAG TPA: fumarylacetoacetate hydrolase family protein [Stellaceae bacterium]|nr:fumarylacetoacetate hydrolase family protein [Stellaceae bacterium]